MWRSKVAAGVATISSLAGAAAMSPVVGYGLVAAMFGLVVLSCAILLPAAWSGKPDRRQAAMELIRLLLGRG
jgi:hypothetical protein